MAFFSSAELDALLVRAHGETDPERRRADYERAEAIVHDEAPWIPTYGNRRFEIWQPCLHGYVEHAVVNARFNDVWLDRRPAPLALREAPLTPWPTDEARAPLPRSPLRLVLVLVLGVTSLSFVVVQVLPGDPTRMLLGPQASAADVKRARALYGFDRPVAARFVTYWAHLIHRGPPPAPSDPEHRSCAAFLPGVHLDLGYSFTTASRSSPCSRQDAALDRASRWRR